MTMENRVGMSGRAWNLSLGILELLLDFIKGFTIVAGVLAASVADWAMGAISVTILFAANAPIYTQTPVWVISLALSLGASAFQIYLFAVLQKRKIGLKQLLAWKKLDKELQALVSVAGGLWLVDTFMDVAPVILLVQDSQYKAIPNLWLLMVGAVIIVVFILCGFSELLTSNMRNILQISPTVAPMFRQNQSQNNQPRQSHPHQNTQRQNQPHQNQTQPVRQNNPATTPAVRNNQPQRSSAPDTDDEITTYLRSRK
jgi:divalent metal cation (Fe/Co/Zn/Cd) transporter